LVPRRARWRLRPDSPRAEVVAPGLELALSQQVERALHVRVEASEVLVRNPAHELPYAPRTSANFDACIWSSTSRLLFGRGFFSSSSEMPRCLSSARGPLP